MNLALRIFKKVKALFSTNPQAKESVSSLQKIICMWSGLCRNAPLSNSQSESTLRTYVTRHGLGTRMARPNMDGTAKTAECGRRGYSFGGTLRTSTGFAASKDER